MTLLTFNNDGISFQEQIYKYIFILNSLSSMLTTKFSFQRIPQISTGCKAVCFVPSFIWWRQLVRPAAIIVFNGLISNGRQPKPLSYSLQIVMFFLITKRTKPFHNNRKETLQNSFGNEIIFTENNRRDGFLLNMSCGFSIFFFLIFFLLIFSFSISTP